MPERAAARLYFGLLLCLTVVGHEGLIYEVAWVRSLELIFGTIRSPIATVLAAFMGGLALGARGWGRRRALWRCFTRCASMRHRVPHRAAGLLVPVALRALAAPLQ